MKNVSWRGGSRAITKLMAIAQFKMENILHILWCDQNFLMKKSDQGKKIKAFYPLQAPNGIDIVV